MKTLQKPAAYVSKAHSCPPCQPCHDRDSDNSRAVHAHCPLLIGIGAKVMTTYSRGALKCQGILETKPLAASADACLADECTVRYALPGPETARIAYRPHRLIVITTVHDLERASQKWIKEYNGARPDQVMLWMNPFGLMSTLVSAVSLHRVHLVSLNWGHVMAPLWLDPDPNERELQKWPHSSPHDFIRSRNSTAFRFTMSVASVPIGRDQGRPPIHCRRRDHSTLEFTR